MWENFHNNNKLLALQEFLLTHLDEKWDVQKRHAILCPRQAAINSTLIHLAISKKLPTLILCNSQDRYREWQNIVMQFSKEGAIDRNFTSLDSIRTKTPFIITHYGHFCSGLNLNKSLK